MALRNLICFLDVLKCNFGEIDEAMFQVVEKHWELILCIQGILKSGLDDVVKVMFQADECP
jgi:hypothetical protein